MWGTVVLAIVIVIAGGIAWWLARGCVVTMIGATGAVLGGLASLGCLVAMLDPDAALQRGCDPHRRIRRLAARVGARRRHARSAVRAVADAGR